MRIRLHTDDFELTGYQNLKVTGENLSAVTQLENSNVDKGEAEEIVVDNVVDYISVRDVEKLIRDWSERLKKEGRLVITGVDIQEVAKSLAYYQSDVSTANDMLYGDNVALPKRVAFSAVSLARFLKDRCGMRILKKRVNGFSYMVEAERR
jgi:hypothetical protein